MHQYTTGESIPAENPHAVSVQLATFEDVIRLEEGDPTLQLQSCYPRFGRTELVQKALADIRGQLPKGVSATVVSSVRAAEDMVGYLELAGAEISEQHGLTVVAHTERLRDQEALAFAKTTGCVASSRLAEDYLLARSLQEKPYTETTSTAEPYAVISNTLKALHAESDLDILLANTGMGGIYSVVRGMRELHPEKTTWVQLGNVYADTTTALMEFGGSVQTVYDVTDLETLHELLSVHSGHVAGVITEAPTNPLVGVADLERVWQVLNKHDAPLIIDVSVAGSAAVNVLPYADVIIESLTKFASGHGDVMMGAVMFNRNAPDVQSLRDACAQYVDAPHTRDAARLAHEITSYRERVRRIGENAVVLADFFESSLGENAVHWSGSRRNSSRFATIARGTIDACGIITITPPNGLPAFYDALKGAKGPSFGMEQTLLTPYTQLAHYDLVAVDAGEQGARELATMGMHKDMARISVGLEDPAELIENFKHALSQ
jgi:cystathionine gamma-synthase